MRSTSPSCCAALVALGVITSWAPAATAQDQSVLAKVNELNKKAMDAYENLDMDEASKFLRQALELCAAEGLNNHKAKARTHVHLGIVSVGGLKQRDRGIQQFKRALEIDSTVALPKSLANPEIQAAFDEAKKEGSGGPTPPIAIPEPVKPPEPAPPAAEPPRSGEPRAGGADAAVPKKIKGVFHEPVTEGTPSSTISVRAAVEPGLGAEKVVLAYRPEGSPDFLWRDMEKDGSTGWHVARIPEPATHGAVVSYYIEARNGAGQALAANGSATEPHVISLAEAGDDGDSDTEDPPGVSRSREGGGGHRYFLSLGLGSGYGWAKGPPEVNPTNEQGVPRDFAGGFAPAQLLHIAPEVGYYLSPNLMLSLVGRLQIVTAATEVRHVSCTAQRMGMVGVCAPAKGAIAVLAKATWFLGEPKAFRPFVSASAGGGEIRHLVALGDLDDCGPGRNLPCKDTILGGLVLLGPGVGFSYNLSQSLSFVASLNSLVGLPKPTVNFDLNVGLALGL